MSDFITRREFIKLLSFSVEDAISLGFAESEDLLYADKYIERRSAVRIVHEYMKKKLGIKDLDDTKKAAALRDLYDCHICVNHIAQVYTRGIMKGIKENVFGLTEKLSAGDAAEIAVSLEHLAATDNEAD